MGLQLFFYACVINQSAFITRKQQRGRKNALKIYWKDLIQWNRLCFYFCKILFIHLVLSIRNVKKNENKKRPRLRKPYALSDESRGNPQIAHGKSSPAVSLIVKVLSHIYITRIKSQLHVWDYSYSSTHAWSIRALLLQENSKEVVKMPWKSIDKVCYNKIFFTSTSVKYFSKD